jgi:hypothetical protein
MFFVLSTLKAEPLLLRVLQAAIYGSGIKMKLNPH